MYTPTRAYKYLKVFIYECRTNLYVWWYIAFQSLFMNYGDVNIHFHINAVSSPEGWSETTINKVETVDESLLENSFIEFYLPVI